MPSFLWSPPSTQPTTGKGKRDTGTPSRLARSGTGSLERFLLDVRSFRCPVTFIDRLEKLRVGLRAEKMQLEWMCVTGSLCYKDYH
ncbi:hypothetical protein CEXT_699261 [Caerostris extrusa]|uniref:Uncharacterized protein n=1 Tax=Caerostris extrusa TaxID=172846 RepID=A0AAV4QJ00_CAEEX|nr:hypothetical protein CEXT_699261 [Caerostris extrusa]